MATKKQFILDHSSRGRVHNGLRGEYIRNLEQEVERPYRQLQTRKKEQK